MSDCCDSVVVRCDWHTHGDGRSGAAALIN